MATKSASFWSDRLAPVPEDFSPSPQEQPWPPNERAAGETTGAAGDQHLVSLPNNKQQSDAAKKSGAGGEANASGGSGAKSSLAQHGLPNDLKRLIIEMLATFQSVSDIQKRVASEFNITLDARTIDSYNPASPRCRVGKRLKAQYNLYRQAYVDSSKEMAVAHQAHRLKLIGRIVEKATTSKDYNAALKGLELAGREMGGALEGKSTVIHEGRVVHSIEDARTEVAMRLASMLEGMAQGTVTPLDSTHPDPLHLVSLPAPHTTGGA